jgi:RNA polymerase sigma factor (sigma-70 family)
MNDVIRHLRTAVLLRDGAGLTDGQLLEGFLLRRDEPAFAALVRRHGPMVLGVCRRVLGNLHDAEDAFQATFLVLARKAASVRSREVVGHWLYRVAYRTAMKAKVMAARRRAKEQQVKEMAQTDLPADDGWRDLLPLLDRELDSLPERYRVAVVLCDLEGVTRREAARRLNLPVGTLSSQLTRARQLLAKRLARYGLAVSGGALTSVLSERMASACLTGALAASTAKAAMSLAAGQGLTAGAVPARVLALSEGVIKTMLLTKLRAFVAVAVVVTVSVGVVGLAYRTTAAEPGKSAGAPATGGAAQAAADDLEALRLEVEALRKGLQATRERVKALEGEVQAMKGNSGMGPQPTALDWGFPVQRGADPASQEPRFFAGGFRTNRGFVVPADLLAEAEAALKKLKERPDDKQAVNALEEALKQLKERTKPEGQPNPAKP